MMEFAEFEVLPGLRQLHASGSVANCPSLLRQATLTGLLLKLWMTGVSNP